jgi:hypothetical protein
MGRLAALSISRLMTTLLITLMGSSLTARCVSGGVRNSASILRWPSGVNCSPATLNS